MNIGIDLGTTNSGLAFVRSSRDADYPEIEPLSVPQYVAAGQIESRRTLPSFLFLGDQVYVGAYAREQGALVPTKSVHSAKSWLSNPEVDRTAKILPWDAQEAGRVMSPVEVSTKILATIRDAWDKVHAGKPLVQQEVVLTVPASFDEEARELTVAAAREAGIEKLTLLEEPAAAFYSWIANHLAQSQKSLFDGQVVLVCDVGGGTSDFTLIRVNRQGDRVEFTRTAVGKHLLLGGDNLDLTLGWLVEAKLGTQLSIRQRSGLRRQCAAAKEKMLADPNVKSVEITVLGAGSSLIGGTLKTEITREEALELTLDGFLPFCELDEKPKEEKRSLFRELGLPYVSDAAVTRHLAAFLSSNENSRPDAILFNGGFFIPEICQQRVADVVEKWFGQRPQILENRDLDLAVAVGAAYYSYVRSTGAGLIVRGGLPRAYYIAIGDQAVCLMPRGTEEGTSLELDRDDLRLVANKPVSFRLYSSLTRVDDQLGQAVNVAEIPDLHMHAPLNAVIRFGKSGERLVPVKLRVRLTEVGTLELWADSKISEHQWRLQFELRKSATASRGPSRPAAVVSDEAVATAETLIDATFFAGAIPPEELPGKLEQALALGRGAWPLSAIRRLADRMIALADARRKSAPLEMRWLNLCGFCLRPGFGFPGDDYRIEQVRRIYASGLTFPNQVQNEIDWWIFWGRVAGGLNRNQQSDIFQRLSPNLLPRGGKKPQRINNSLLREMWRTAASLELLPQQTKTQLGDALLAKIKAGDMRETSLWCIARIGARKLFYGPINQVLPVSTATRWVEALAKWEGTADALVSIARRTGDSTRDLAPAALEIVRRSIPESLIPVLEGEEEEDLGKVFGEELPSGLVVAESAS
ncbi:MAG TPA: Hsp70 family protein [Thermoanaerobaculia bacterium]|nr:Hsp70 family protein [Thermoanaerobaculia bacterium]